MLTSNQNKPENLLGVLQVMFGACVMLTTNVDITDGLTNGTMDTVPIALEIKSI